MATPRLPISSRLCIPTLAYILLARIHLALDKLRVKILFCVCTPDTAWRLPLCCSAGCCAPSSPVARPWMAIASPQVCMASTAMRSSCASPPAPPQAVNTEIFDV